jgi:hypothetical protein
MRSSSDWNIMVCMSNFGWSQTYRSVKIGSNPENHVGFFLNCVNQECQKIMKTKMITSE